MPADVRDLYETIAQATGRTKNDVMVEVLRVEGQRRVNEIAMIIEGREQARVGRLSPIGDVIDRFKAKGRLPVSFDMEKDDADAVSP